MSGTGECDDVRPALGVYVLGAVEPADRRLIDQHLVGCSRCRSELAGLAGLPALLGKVSADEVAGVVEADAAATPGRSWPSGQALRSQLARAARIRRFRLGAWISVAVVVGAMAGSGAMAMAVARVHRPSPLAVAQRPLARHAPVSAPVTSGSGYVTTARVTDPQTRVSATVRYAREAWGLLIGVRLEGVATGTPCRLEVVDTLGRATTAGGWTVTSPSGTWYPGSSSLALADVSGFIVTSGSKVLVVVTIGERVWRSGDSRPHARLVPHDRRSAPAFGVSRSPAHLVRPGANTYQMTSHVKRMRRTGSSGDATDLTMACSVRPPSRVRG